MALKFLKISDNKILSITVYILSFLVNILLYFVIFSHLTENGINYYFNADTLYFPTLFKDIFVDGYSIKGWHIPAAPNVLPDMLLYFIIMAFFRNPIYASFVYGIVQFLIFLLLINWLINIISQKKNYLLNSIVNLTMSLFFFVYIFSEDFFFTFHIISNTYHLGAFIFALITFAFTLKYLITQKKLFLYLMLLIASLAVFNDKLFIIIFSIPLFVSVIFINKKNFKRIINILAADIISVMIGVLLFRLFQLSKIVHFAPVDNLIDFSRIKFSSNLFLSLIESYINKFSFHTLIIFISIITTIVSIIYLIKNLRKNFFNKENEIKNIETIKYLYFLFFLVSSVTIFFAPMLSGTFLGFDCIRYNIFTFYILVFNIFPIIYYFNKKLENSNTTKYFFLSISIITITIYTTIFSSNFKKEGLKEYFSYYPKCAECIDDFIEKNKNIYGISTYWIGKVALNFSKKGARIYTVYDDSFYPYPHVGNINWYSDNKGKYSRPVYTFIIVEKKQDLTIITKNFGNPIKIDTCDKYLFFTYPEFKFNHKNEPYFVNLESISKQKYFSDFENEIYRVNNNILISDKFSFSGKYSNLIDKNSVYSYTHSLKYSEIKNLNPKKAQVNCELYFNQYTEVNIVFSINDGEKTIVWQNLKIDKNIIELNKWQQFTLMINLPENIDETAIIKAYVWNNGTTEVFIDDLKLEFF